MKYIATRVMGTVAILMLTQNTWRGIIITGLACLALNVLVEIWEREND